MVLNYQKTMTQVFHACIRKVPDSNLGRHANYLDFGVVLLSPSRQMTELYLRMANTASFYILSNS
jgi:hypothetical protein